VEIPIDQDWGVVLCTGRHTIKMSIHKTLSEEHFPIESKVKYMYRINPQGYQACVVEVEVEAIQIGVQHSGGREATGV
jgi:hypothetical protein